MKKILITALAASLALTSLTAAPARAGSDDVGKILLGAGALFIIGSALSRHHDRDRHVTRRHVHRPHIDQDWNGRGLHLRHNHRVLPRVCLRQNRWGGGPHRVMFRRCLANNMHRIGRLPGVCQFRLHTHRGTRHAFSPRCLRRHGWVIG
jgi:Ni/Co efflux regulator RcnB